jgi:polyphosphate:AMP phosphotransferase
MMAAGDPGREMFEEADGNHRVAKSEYRLREAALREALVLTQYELLRAPKFATLILIAGVDGAGKGETVNLLNEWMDPRHIEVAGFPPPTPDEAAHPPMWRFWRALPPKGKIGVFFGAWHTIPILARVTGKIDDAALRTRTDEIQRFEQMLADEGVLLLKFWFHLSKAQQKARMQALEKDPDTAWRVTEEERAHFRQYDRFRAVSGDFVAATSTGIAPWRIVPGADANYRALCVGDQLLAALKERLAAPEVRAAAPALAPLPRKAATRLRDLDLSKSVAGTKDYRDKLAKWQGRLNRLSRDTRFKQGHAAVCVFEGNDAAGKGGAIRRVTHALDARYYRTVSIAAPSEEERAQPYLWRFWRHVPRHGFFTLYDRSWYGRVLVERVEGLAQDADWRRAYAEINDFESELTSHGLVICKFWLAIDQDEQLRRFKAREETSFKQFKITEEDWRNRDKWPAYEKAVCEMLARTSPATAPWTVVEANDKRHARIKVIKTLVKAIEARLDAG